MTSELAPEGTDASGGQVFVWQGAPEGMRGERSQCYADEQSLRSNADQTERWAP